MLIGQSELLWPLGPPVALVALARPAGKLEPRDFACSWPENRSRSCRCLFHRISSWAGASHQCSTGKVSVNWPKWTAVTTWTTSCLGRSGSACGHTGATKLSMLITRGSVQALALSVLSYLVVGRRVTPMLYRQSKCELAKVNCCDHLDHQLPWSLWLGLQASWSHQTWHAHGQRIDLGTGVVCFIVSCRGPLRHTNALPAK